MYVSRSQEAPITNKNMDNNRLQQLLNQYVENTITRADCEELLTYFDEGDPSVISVAIDQVFKTGGATVSFAANQKENVYNRLLAHARERQSEMQGERSMPRARSLAWIRIAALLTVVVSVGVLLLYIKPAVDEGARQEQPLERNDILLPDQNQALLTLADGRTIVLSDSLDGILALESGVRIRRGEDGSIIYDGSQAKVSEGLHKFNTFTTPKGHTYQLLLPDGTKIWLNTATSVRYPVVFATNERKISLTGEAYFEVARDVDKPFKVEAKGSLIEVLGTQFNVSAFEDDTRVITTLLEGAVDVSKNKQHVILKPGEQAVVDDKLRGIDRSTVDVRAATAWRNGYFRFDNESIESIITKISRWYDIETVEYQGRFTDRFTGTFQRSKDVSVLFSHLEKIAPIRFDIKERGVVIMK